MFHYFAEDGTETEDADQLYERLVALLSPVAGDEDMAVLSKDQLLAGHPVPDRPFVVRVADEARSAEDRVAAWLATPNPSLGGDRPDHLLRGDASGRCRLGHLIAEMEQGAFS